MSPAYVRWRIERLAELLRTMGRKDALCAVAAEEIEKPWLDDPRPPPPALPMGGYYSHQPA